MAKSTQSKSQQPAGHKAQREQRKPSAGTSIKAPTLEQMAHAAGITTEQAEQAVAQSHEPEPQANGIASVVQQAEAHVHAAEQAKAEQAAAPKVPRAVAAVSTCAPVEGKHGLIALDALPKYIAAKGTNTGVIPKDLENVVFYEGKPFTARSPHNAEWARKAIELCKQGGKDGCTALRIAQAGIPIHTLLYFIKNGWISKVQRKAEQQAATV